MAIKRRGKTGKTKKSRFAAKFCPRCGSTDVFWAQGMPQFWSLWQCKNCGYRGPVILEDGNMAGKLQEEWVKKLSRNQT
jgi:DNA-directed RNA polymerase subunit M